MLHLVDYKLLPMFQNVLMPSSSGSSSPVIPDCFAAEPKDEGAITFRNVGNYSPLNKRNLQSQQHLSKKVRSLT